MTETATDLMALLRASIDGAKEAAPTVKLVSANDGKYLGRRNVQGNREMTLENRDVKVTMRMKKAGYLDALRVAAGREPAIDSDDPPTNDPAYVNGFKEGAKDAELLTQEGVIG